MEPHPDHIMQHREHRHAKWLAILLIAVVIFILFVGSVFLIIHFGITPAARPF